MSLPEVKRIIKYALEAAGKPVDMYELEMYYGYCSGGRRIPYARFYYETAEQFVRSLTDTCMVKGEGRNVKVSLIKRYIDPVPDNNDKVPARFSLERPQENKEPPVRLKQPRPAVEKKQSLAATPSALKNSETVEKRAERLEVPQALRQRLSEVMLNHPEGMWCRELPTFYKARYGMELLSGGRAGKGKGFQSVSELCARCPDVVRMVRPGCCDWLLFHQGRPLPDYLDTMLADMKDVRLQTRAYLEQFYKMEGVRSQLVRDIDALEALLYGDELVFARHSQHFTVLHTNIMTLLRTIYPPEDPLTPHADLNSLSIK